MMRWINPWMIAAATLLLAAGLSVRVRAAPGTGASGSDTIEMLPTLTQPTAAAGHAQSSPFDVRALHLSLRLKRGLSLDRVHRLIDQIALRGYNMVVLGLNSPHYTLIEATEPGRVRLTEGLTAARMKTLIAYARSKGVEPVMELKIIGKEAKALGPLARHYPGVLIPNSQGVINTSFHFPDGGDGYDAAILPMLNKIISWYGDQPPRYLMLGTDEVPVEALVKAGKPRRKSAAQVFAYGLNRCADLLFKQHVTPVIWGDTLLSTRLASDQAVKGFPGDSRFGARGISYAYAYNAEAGAGNTRASLLPAVNLIDHRERIIVADWHYWPQHQAQYPSVDYFQAMGFKDVWPATWEDEQAIREFTRYGESRHVGGMMATTWFLPHSPAAAPRFPPVVNNSILYFLNPSFQPPRPILKSWTLQGGDAQGEEVQPVAQGAWGMVFPLSASSIGVRVQTPDSVRAQRWQCWLMDENGGARYESPAQAQAAQASRVASTPDAAHAPTADIDLAAREAKGPSLFTLGIRYRDAATGYLAQQLEPGVMGLSNAPPLQTGDASADALVCADFTALKQASISSPRLLTAPGKSGALLFLRGNSDRAAMIDGALDCTAVDAAYAFPLRFWDRIASHGMKLVVEAKTTRELKGGPWCALVSFGGYHQGFRLVMWKSGKLEMQFARALDASKPVRLTPPQHMEAGRWTRIEVTLSPPDAKGDRTAAMRVNGQEPTTAVLRHALTAPAIEVPLGLGVEFTKTSRHRKQCPNFPGLIRSVKILSFTQEARPKNRAAPVATSPSAEG